MSQHLILRFGVSLDKSINYAVVDDSQEHVISSGIIGNTDQLNSISIYFDYDLVVLLPASKFLFKELTFPKKYNESMKESISYMIEGDISNDLDDIEIVVLSSQGKTVHIMAFEKSYYQEIVDVLEKYDLEPSKIMIDAFALPFQNDKFSVINLDNELIIRQGKYSGFNLPSNLAKKYFEMSENPSFLCFTELDFEGEKHNSYVDHPMGFLAKQSLKNPILLQGQIGNSISLFKNTLLKPWYKVLFVVFLIMVVSYIQFFVDWIKLEKENTRIKEDIIKVFKTKFPSVKKIVNPMAQFKQQTNQVVSNDSDVSFIYSLSTLIESFDEHIKLQTLSYDKKSSMYKFKLIYTDLDYVENTKNTLNVRGYDADFNDITNKKGVKTVTLQVKENNNIK